MSNPGIILLFFVFLSSIYFLFTINDPASPQFVYLVKLSVFFSSIFFIDHNYEIYLIFFLILLILIYFNSLYLLKYKGSIELIKTNPITLKKINIPSTLFWIVSAPSLIALYYLINKFGGFKNFFEFDGFLSVGRKRTEFLAGMGIIKTIISTFYIIHLYYFAYLINSNYKKYKTTYLFYGLHFLIFIFFAFISFSRGTLLMMFVMMGLVWHYSHKRINTLLIIFSLACLMLFASFHGMIRDTVKFNDGKINFNYNFNEQGIKKTWMKVGTYPLETLLNTKVIDKQLGLTYISGVTIFVPRSIWPNKFDPGGVVFTKNYTNLYDEFSDFTTGLYPEAILNFGVIFGIIFGTLQLILLIYWLNTLYIKLILKNHKNVLLDKSIFYLLFYLYTLIAGVNLLTGEFTNIFKNWVVQIVILSFVFYIINIFRNTKFK
jgi:hypothetical protein